MANLWQYKNHHYRTKYTIVIDLFFNSQVGNGDSFVFTLNPKMAIFYATGKNENFMFLDQSNHGLGLGGKVSAFKSITGFEIFSTVA